MGVVVPKQLENEVDDFLRFLRDPKRDLPNQYELTEARFDCVKYATQGDSGDTNRYWQSG